MQQPAIGGNEFRL